MGRTCSNNRRKPRQLLSEEVRADNCQGRNVCAPDWPLGCLKLAHSELAVVGLLPHALRLSFCAWTLKG